MPKTSYDDPPPGTEATSPASLLDGQRMQPAKPVTTRRGSASS